MSESTNAQSANGGFAKAFLPGLIIGLVIGSVGGAFLAPIIADGSGPAAQIERSRAEAAKAPPAPPGALEQAADNAQQGLEQAASETQKAVEQGAEELKKKSEEAAEALKQQAKPDAPKPEQPKPQ